MSFPNLYNVTNTSGTFNLVPIAYGQVIWNNTIQNLYNCTVALGGSANIVVTITVSPTSGNYLPIATPYIQGQNSLAVTSVSGNIITFTGYAATGDKQNTNATFIIYGY